jgi:hypothetical protein
MGDAGPRHLPRRSARAGRLQRSRPKPNLQGPLAGEALVGKLLGQLHADPAGSPAGMGALVGQGGFYQFGGEARPRLGTAGVIGGQPVGTAKAKPLPDAAHRPVGKAQGVRHLG